MKKLLKIFIFSFSFLSLIVLPGVVEAQFFGDFEDVESPLPESLAPETPFERQQREGTFRDPGANPFLGQLAETGGELPVEYTAQSGNPFLLVARIVRVFLGFLGVGTIVLMVWAGARWMTAGGNEEQVNKAKRTLRNAVIGLIIILSGYSISTFVIRRLQRQTGAGFTRFTTGSLQERFESDRSFDLDQNISAP